MARGDFPSAKQDQFVLRFPDGMRDRLKEAAAGNGRSLNAEIIARLQAIFDAEDSSLTSDDLLTQSIKQNASLLKEMKHQTKVLEWMREQQSVSYELLRAVAESDGHLSADFMRALRTAVSPRNLEETGFPADLDEG